MRNYEGCLSGSARKPEITDGTDSRFVMGYEGEKIWLLTA